MSNGLRTSKGPASPPYAHGPYEWNQICVMQKPSVDSYKRYTLEENFHRVPAASATIDQVWTTEAARNANIDFETLGTDFASGTIAFATNEGGVALTTHSTSADQMIVLPHLDSGQSAWTGVLWGTENQVIWESIIRTGSSVADVTIWAGLKLTNASIVATDDDAAYFRFDGAVANWEATTSIAGTDVEQDTGIVVAADTNYYFRIEIDGDRKAHFFINNKEVYSSTALTNDIDLIPYVGVQTTTTGAKHIYLVKEKISRIIFE